MNYVELLAKSLYEQQNHPKKWINVERDFPYFNMRDMWLQHAKGEVEQYVTTRDDDPYSDLPKRLADVERGLDEMRELAKMGDYGARLRRLEERLSPPTAAVPPIAISVPELLDRLGVKWDNAWISNSWGQTGVRATGISDTPVGDMHHVLVVKL